MREISFEGNGSNFLVTCPSCTRQFDAAPDDGTYSTIDGRLQLVRALRSAAREVLADAPTRAEMQALAEALRQAVERREDVAAAVASTGTFPRLEEWARNNKALAALILVLLPVLLTWLLSDHGDDDKKPLPIDVTIEVDDERVAALVDELIRRESGHQPPPGPGDQHPEQYSGRETDGGTIEDEPGVSELDQPQDQGRREP